MTIPTAWRREGRIRRFRRVARSGFAINGIIHLLIGGIALRLAFGDDLETSIDQSGALQQLSNTVLGRVLLWAAVIGSVTLGLWQLTWALVLIDHPKLATRWGKRVVEAAKGAFYLGVGATALVFALGGRTSPSENIRRLTVVLLQTQAGVFILVAVGLTAFGFGVGFVSIGARRTFRKLIRVPAGRFGRLVLALGVLGYVAKGLALGVVGIIFVAAATTGDPRQASGLDGALRALLDLPSGAVLLASIGLGFVLFGVFLIVRTRLARL